MTTHHSTAWAKVRRALPNHTIPEQLVVLLIGALESSYGRAPSFGDSRNWGAVTGAGPAGFFEHKDSRYDAKTGKVIHYTTKFKKYATDDQAIQDVARIALKPETRSAANARSLHGVSSAMYDQKYYLGTQPRDKAILSHAKLLTSLAQRALPSVPELRIFFSSQPATPASQATQPATVVTPKQPRPSPLVTALSRDLLSYPTYYALAAKTGDGKWVLDFLKDDSNKPQLLLPEQAAASALVFKQAGFPTALTGFTRDGVWLPWRTL